jgi:2-phospho-L-lactate transferase/gluconeogenesis factor (CofD/UPF0052 family)
MRHAGLNIVAIGGGTGLSTLLRGLKVYVDAEGGWSIANLAAVVTVTDEGGSSGALRKEFGMLPPGDIRNCIVALAEEEALLSQLFNYRFETDSALKGHSLGNLLLTAMTDITGGFDNAVLAASEVLAIRGEIYPSTLSDVRLRATLADGSELVGEVAISEKRVASRAHHSPRDRTRRCGTAATRPRCNRSRGSDSHRPRFTVHVRAAESRDQADRRRAACREGAARLRLQRHDAAW